jgi:parallel beta-helix repeat protein
MLLPAVQAMKSRKNSKKVEYGKEPGSLDRIPLERIGRCKSASGQKTSRPKLKESRRNGKLGSVQTPSKIVIGLLFCLVLALAAGFPAGHGVSSASSVGILQAHDPIIIVGNAGFGVPGNYASGVTGGSGTATDPFIIQGWDIDLSCFDCLLRVPTKAGIVMDGTTSPITAYFVIRNVSIHDGLAGTVSVQLNGISFSNVQNGLVQSVVLNRDRFAVDLTSSSHNVFRGNQLTSNGAGFSLWSSSFNTFLGNIVSIATLFGFDLKDSSDNVFAYNRVEGSFGGFNLASLPGVTTRNILTGNLVLNVGQDGFALVHAPGNRLENNTVAWTAGFCVNSMTSTCPDGFHLQSSNDNILIGNVAKDNPNDGFFLDLGSSNNLLKDNIALRSTPLLRGPGYLVGLGAGFAVFASSGNTLVSNTADENTDGFALSLASHNRFVSNLARYNGEGFVISGDSSLNVFSNNDVYRNGDAGFFWSLQGSPGTSNTFTYNRVHNNHMGFELTEFFSGSTSPYSNDTLLGNMIFENNFPAAPFGGLPQSDGIYLSGITKSNITSNIIFNNPTGLEWSTSGTLSAGNLVYNNVFINTVNVNDFVQNRCGDPLGQQYPCNSYNTTIVSRTNIIGGPLTGGNYWSDYYGTDLNYGDGIGRTLVPYQPGAPGFLPFLGGDYYPLVPLPQTGTLPDVGGFIIPTSLTVNQNTNGTMVLAAFGRNGFTGTVPLSAAITPVAPGGPTVSFNPSSLSVPSKGTVASALNLTNTSVPGVYTLQITIVGSTTHIVSRTISIVSKQPLLSIVRGMDNGIYLSGFFSSWSGWGSLSGATAAPPVLCSSALGSFDLIVRGSDNASIWHRSYSNGVWSAWNSPGGVTRDQPACAFQGGLLRVVVRGTDNGLWYNYRNDTSGVWGTWQSLGGFATGPPVLVASPAGWRLDLIVQGNGNTIWHKSFLNGAWSASWDSPTGSTPSFPAAASDGRTLHLVVRGTDNGAWYNSLNFTSGLWSGWSSLGGATPTAPSLVVGASRAVHLAVVGLDGGIYHKMKTGAGVWALSWDSAGGSTNNSVALGASGTRLAIVVRGIDGGIWYNSLAGSSWRGWTGIGGTTPSTPSLGALF